VKKLKTVSESVVERVGEGLESAGIFRFVVELRKLICGGVVVEEPSGRGVRGVERVRAQMSGWRGL